uniref:DNA polymerase n=1 Tax=Oryzias latipes TaxID=8090 RepID=A0A286P9R0_ORYLA|nr:DNA polymerase [Oryzias latipes]
MDRPIPFVNLFPDIFPKRRAVSPSERGLIGLMVKSVMFHRLEEALLCRGLVLQAHNGTTVYTTVCFKVVGIMPVVGYDLELDSDQGDACESWERVSREWRRHFAAEPAHVRVVHDDVKREVKAAAFPLGSIALAKKYMETVKGALTFGDFHPESGYYVARDGNTPALCCDVMYGRVYFLPEEKCGGTLVPSELVYDHERSEEEAKLFDTVHAPHVYRAACLDIETVVDEAFRDRSLRCEFFAHRFPYCTERTVSDLTAYRSKLVKILSDLKKGPLRGACRVSIPALASDMPGQEHEITCVSLVLMNSHLPKPEPGSHRKQLIVVYNKLKVKGQGRPKPDGALVEAVGLESASRILFYPCAGELALLEQTLRLLDRHGVELLYVYNAEFDLRVIDQRVHFYADSNYAERSDEDTRRRCAEILRSWHGLFVTRHLSEDLPPVFRFESVRHLEIYKEMLTAVGSSLTGGKLTEREVEAACRHVDKFNKDKGKLGHFKMIGCGMTVVDLYRMAGTREIRFACTSMKLNDVAPFVISRDRELRGLPPKDPRKLRKLTDVPYSMMDGMIHRGGTELFAVLLYNLVDSQLCSRMAKALKPASALFHRCRITLNIDVVVHGRGDNFGGFVQSIHSVQMPQLKYVLDTLRVRAGPSGRELSSREPWDASPPGLDGAGEDTWKGGSVCEPLSGLHYSGPGMGLELAFDFASMYPSIMCALNISPETTVPWPPRSFPHDLSGWVVYKWEAEGFEYATLILRYDADRAVFERAPAVFSSSVEHYLNRRDEFKAKLKDPALCDAERAYYKVQEAECKVMANSFYGTAPPPCGSLISGHGRRQISVVNDCVSTFYKNRCPVMYGDTDSVMVSAGYGPDDLPESDVSDEQPGDGESPELETERLRNFAAASLAALGAKFERAASEVPGFLRYVHLALVEDTLKRMYTIERGNEPVAVIRDPEGAFTEEGYPVYVAQTPDSRSLLDVTRPFVKDRRVKLEYEYSSSVYCHVAKKSYVSLTHNLDGRGRMSSSTVKIRGLSAVKSLRSPCDSAVADTFVACVMRGDCVKLEPHGLSCFSTLPWHRLSEGDLVLYPESELTVDGRGRWEQLDRAQALLVGHRVLRVTELELDGGFLAVSVTLARPGSGVVTARALYKDGTYCMNHLFSSRHGVLRDLLACRASELIASKMGAGFFPWSALVKSAKNKHFSQQTLERFKASKSGVKTTYVEIVRTWLQRITGLSVKPVECEEFYKCSPIEAAFYRYPLNLQATSGCTTAMFGGSLACLSDKHARGCDGEAGARSASAGRLVPHPCQPQSQCFADARVLTAHKADRELVGRSGKLVAHCIVDYCLPRRMYGSGADELEILADCRRHLILSFSAVRERLSRATATFNALMNVCPEHMEPACGLRELERLRALRRAAPRLTGDKLEACRRVLEEDLALVPREVYAGLIGELGRSLALLTREGVVRVGTSDEGEGLSSERIALRLPTCLLVDAGLAGSEGSLSISKSEASERALVDLAGLLYQTLLALHVRSPDAFSSVVAREPDSTLRIMPYTTEDPDALRAWIEDFKSKKWLVRPAPPTGQKRTARDRASLGGTAGVTYHCAGCKDFFRDLCANKVSGRTLLRSVYGDNGKRKLGRCVNEAWWLR